jgi:hypothetical protein
MRINPLGHTSPRGQLVVMLLAALRELYVGEGLRVVTKQKAIGVTGRKHWFALEDEDLEPYPSQCFLTSEPRWHTLIAWARKDSVLHDLVSYEGHDAWGLTRPGREMFERFHKSCRAGVWPVSPCFLWSAEFKLFMNPEHLPGPSDASRPRFFYRDKIFGPFLVTAPAVLDASAHRLLAKD